MGIEEELQKILEERNTVGSKVGQIITKIKNGEETTGDPLKDFLLVRYGGDSSEYMDNKYRLLQKDINQHIGEQVLIIKEHYIKNERHGCMGSYSLPEHITYFMALGVINGELSFDVKESTLIIPAQKHVLKGCEDYSYLTEKCCFSQNWGEKTGPIKIQAYDFENSNRIGVTSLQEPRGSIAIIPSNEFVGLYFALSEGYDSVYDSIFESLWQKRQLIFEADEKLEPEVRENAWKELRESIEHHLHFTEVTKNQLSRHNKEYIQGLQLLGVKFPDQLQQAYDSHKSNQRKEVLDTLVQGKATESTIRNAVKLEMHTTPMTVERESGLILDVPKYIQAQCEKYKIKIE